MSYMLTPVDVLAKGVEALWRWSWRLLVAGPAPPHSRRDSGVGQDQSPRTRGAGPEKQQMAMVVSTMVLLS